MSKTPEDLHYSATHEWVRDEPDGTVSVGITDFAQESLGDIVFVEFPKPGASVTAGRPCGVVESVKAASDLNAPLSGTVTAANDSLIDAWERINQDPYGAWLFRIKPNDPVNSVNAAERGALLDAAAYAASAVAKS